MRSQLIRLAKLIFGFAVSIVAVIWLVVFVALFWPSLLLNKYSLREVERLLQRRGVGISWNDAAIDLFSGSLSKRSFRLRFSDLCWKPSDVELKACFGKAALSFSIDLGRFSPRLQSIDDIELLQGYVTADFRSRSEMRDAKRPTNGRGVVLVSRWLGAVKIGGVAVNVNAIKVKTDEGTLSGKLRIDSVKDAHGNLVLVGKIDESLAAREPTIAHSAHIKFVLTSENQKIRGPWTFSWNAKAEAKAGTRLELSGAADLSDFPQKTDGWISGRLAGALSPITEIRFGRCRYSIAEDRNEERSIKYKFKCPLVVGAKFANGGTYEGISLPSRISFVIDAELASVFPPQSSSLVSGRVALNTLPVTTELYALDAAAIVNITGVPSEFPKSWTVDGRVRSRFTISSFESAVRALRMTPIAVPAPFNTLDGSVSLLFSGVLDEKDSTFPFLITTRLKSANQSLDMNSNGTFELRWLRDRWIKYLNAETEIVQAQIALPRLDPRSVPRFYPDERIREFGESESGVNAWFYSLRFYNRPNKPVRFMSNLSIGDIPAAFDVKISNDNPLLGYVRLSNFPVKFFRRDAWLEHLEISLTKEPDGTGVQPVNGLLRVDYTDYTMRVRVDGTISKPIVKLSSNPPLPENQLVAVLFFGRPIEELSDLEGQSASNVRAALADGAVSFASLYLLSSTPIESVGFDPRTNSFTAKLRLGEGTSLNIGSDAGGVPHVGIRARLSRFWTITTSLDSPVNDDNTSVSALLEYSNRY